MTADLAPTRRRIGWRALVKNRKCLAGLIMLATLVSLTILAAAGGLPHDPLTQNPQARIQGPSTLFWLGTDQFGRDVLARTAAAIGGSLRIAALAVLIAAVAGTAGGLSAAFFGRVADSAVSVVTNVLFAFPPLLLALTLAAVLNAGWTTVAVAIAIVYVPIFIRVSRGPALALREAGYVKAAISTGQHPLQIVIRHVLPNVGSLVILQIALSLSWAVLTEASLSYLGLGVPPPAASLGSMIFDARILLYVQPYTLAAPGVAIALMILGFNLLGDGLRDLLDPKDRGPR